MLISIPKYLERYDADSRPTIATVRRWIRDGKLKAERRGRSYYIDDSKLPPSTGNVLADRVLRKMEAA
jgi:hypothetical protein